MKISKQSYTTFVAGLASVFFLVQMGAGYAKEECECNDGSAQWVENSPVTPHTCTEIYHYPEGPVYGCELSSHGQCKNDKIKGPGWNCVETGDPNDDCEISRVNATFIERSITGCSDPNDVIGGPCLPYAAVGDCEPTCDLQCESTPSSRQIEVACND